MNEQKDITIKDSVLPAPTWEGSSAESVSRLVTAVYMVASFLSDSEPLKGHLKSKVLSLFSDTVSFIKDTKKSPSCIVISIEEIMSLIDTARHAGLLSSMNRDILISEFGRFLEGIKTLSQTKDQRVLSSIQNMFSVPLSVPKKEEPLPQVAASISKGHDFKKPPAKNVLYKKPVVKVAVQKNTNGERKDTILKVLKDKGETTIKDIASNIAGCSEKTIQRDLNEMVDKGVIKKKGERRWTTYFVS